ncbi:MAG: hypothetical protein JNJ83_10975 [Verrucomicrobiaceae bacterium]|nr:hypothetical protein [Verrucomicrobiaceae bacterium]
MITQIEQGLANYLGAAMAEDQPTVVARAATSSEGLDRTRPLVYVKVALEFLPGSETKARGNVEFVVMTPANVGDNDAAKQADIEAALMTALSRTNLTAISAAVLAASGFNATGMVWEGFRDGADKQFWSPYLPVLFSFVKPAV